MTTQRIVVFGATGDQGAAQVRGLARAGHDVVAVSRSGTDMAVDGTPVAGAAADVGDPAAIARVLAGAEAVFLNLPSTSFQAAEPLIAGTRTIAAAARAAGVARIVFNTSLPVPEEARGFAAQDARRTMRTILFDSGVPTISIEPVVFLDNLLKGWALPPLVERRTVVYAHDPALEVSWICHADLAALMIAALERPQLAGRSFAVGGAETVRLPQLAGRLSEGWGLPIGWESQSIPDFCQTMRRVFEGRASLEADRMIDELGRIYTWYNFGADKPFKVDMAPVLAELPVRLTPIAEWARANPLPG